jgi:hypothetical protein
MERGLLGLPADRFPVILKGDEKEQMSGKGIREKTSIHLYMPAGSLPEARALRLQELRGEGIDALWIEMGKRGDSSTGPDTAGKKETGRIHGLPVIYRPLAESSLKRATALSPAGIAVDPRWADHLIAHADTVRKWPFPLYLISPPQSPESLKEELEAHALSVEKLRSAGLENLYCHIPISHSTALYNAYGFLKRDLQVKTIVGLTMHGDKRDLLFRGALHIGSLFYEGFADAIVLIPRSSAPLDRHEILGLLGIAKGTLATIGRYPIGYCVISCPMCGRCEIDIPGMTEQVDQLMHAIEIEYRQKGKPLENSGGITVAVMGCNVNGPGEARGADIGIAGGRGGSGTIFLKGRVHLTLPEQGLLDEFSNLVRDLIDEKLETG